MRCETDGPGGTSRSDFFRQVTGRAERILIVATGPSAEALDLSLVEKAAGQGVTVIAVNGAIEWLPVAHVWFTLDPGPINRPRMRNRRAGVEYYAAVPDDYGTPFAEHSCHRGPAEDGVTFLRRRCGAVRPGTALSDDPGIIVSGNSAFGAMQVGWLMGGQRFAMIGVDGTREPYAHGSRRPTWNFLHLPGLFRSCGPQLKERGAEVRNGSPQSIVRCFRRCRPNEAVEWVIE